MGFSQMMELLQKKNHGKIVICNMGNFYISIGKDAILLNHLINLKVSCFKPEICKVGFPINSLEKYTDLLVQKRYSYIVYYFDQEKEELQILEEYKGKYNNNLKERNINCYICSKSTGKYKRPDKYIIALSKLYEKEEQIYLKEDKEDYKKDKEQIHNQNSENKSKKEEMKRKRKIWFQKKNKKTN